MTETKLIIGLPSKGRIHEQVTSFLKEASFPLKRVGSARGYTARLETLADAEVQLLSAGEIAGALESGQVHVGITGLDLLRERGEAADRSTQVLRPLGFSKARVVVAVPECWLDVDTMDDLADVAETMMATRKKRLRVATKFHNLTRAYFAENEVIDYRIMNSLGATEGAPASGSADLIVDITETGSTLVANDLKILEDGVILKSEAVLAGSLTAPWSEPALGALRHLLTMIDARQTAQSSFLVEVADWNGGAEQGLSDLGCRVTLTGGKWAQIRGPRKLVYQVLSVLKQSGMKELSVREASYIAADIDDPIADFAARLAQS